MVLKTVIFCPSSFADVRAGCNMAIDRATQPLEGKPEGKANQDGKPADDAPSGQVATPLSGRRLVLEDQLGDHPRIEGEVVGSDEFTLEDMRPRGEGLQRDGG